MFLDDSEKNSFLLSILENISVCYDVIDCQENRKPSLFTVGPRINHFSSHNDSLLQWTQKACLR